jgi:kumamolisin
MSKRVVALCGAVVFLAGVLSIPMFAQSADRTKGDAGRTADRSPGSDQTPTAVPAEEVDEATLVEEADAPEAILDSSEVAQAPMDVAKEGRNTPPGLAEAALVSHANPGHPIYVTISLDLRDRAGAEALTAAQHDPTSPLYNQWITPADFQTRFGPLPEDLQAAADFLAAQGFTDIAQPASRMITGTGTVGIAERAFGVTINNYNYRGRSVYSNDREPVLPPGLAGKVARVGGLDSLTIRFPSYFHASSGNLYYTHRDWALAYGETATFNAGNKATPGVRIAIAGAYQVEVPLLSDIFTREGGTAFGYNAWTAAQSGQRTLFQGSSAPPTGTCVVTQSVQGSNGCSLSNSGAFNSLEAQLDAVMISSTANDAHIDNYMVNNLLVDSFTTMYQYIADQAANVKVVSTSWGLCVGLTPDSTIANDDAVFLQADAAGQAWFASSGDGGSNDCGGSPNPDTDWPATSSHITGAGGSDMNDNFDANGWNQGYAAETACSDGGGGIPSKSGTIYNRPSWQTGPGVPSGTKRLVPDISAHYGRCGSSTKAAYAVTLGGFIFETSGTSAISPMWAGAWAVGNQVVGQNMGYASPLLYRILRSEAGTSYSNSFHDITSGSNGAYSATSGYDMTTGIGTPKWGGLYSDLGLLFITCTTNAECDDANACTTDVCNAGACTHTPINCDDGNACTTDSCSGGVCSHTAITCSDGTSCTTDTCNPTTGCVFTWPACGLNDSCCGPGCSYPSDPNCCRPSGTSCTTNSQCCSGSCRPNHRCR